MAIKTMIFPKHGQVFGGRGAAVHEGRHLMYCQVDNSIVPLLILGSLL